MAVGRPNHPARWAGERFDLHACVQALFTIKLPEQMKQDQQAA